MPTDKSRSQRSENLIRTVPAVPVVIRRVEAEISVSRSCQTSPNSQLGDRRAGEVYGPGASNPAGRQRAGGRYLVVCRSLAIRAVGKDIESIGCLPVRQFQFEGRSHSRERFSYRI